MNFVVDASVAVKWFVQEELRAEARELLRRDEALYAPALVLAEISNTLWKKVLRNEISDEQAQKASHRSHDPFSRLYPLDALNRRALEIALDLQHPVYDCFYIACAEEVGDGRVVTVDRRLRTAVEGTACEGLVVHLLDIAG